MISKATREVKKRVLDTARLPKNGLAAPVAIMALAALTVAGCGPAKKYGDKTERAMQGRIQPVMVDIAKKAVALQAQYPDAVTTSTAGKGIIHIQGYGTDKKFGTSSDFDIVMRTAAGTGTPEPSTVMSVTLDKDDNPPPGYGPESSLTIELASPDGGHHGYGGLFDSNPHPDGWVAGEVNSMDLGGDYANTGGVYNSSVSYEFAPDGKGNSFGPVGTSRVIASDALSLYAKISAEIVQNQQ